VWTRGPSAALALYSRTGARIAPRLNHLPRGSAAAREKIPG
jgi:hypothetical protein